jgi:hypothetical protein
MKIVKLSQVKRRKIIAQYIAYYGLRKEMKK